MHNSLVTRALAAWLCLACLCATGIVGEDGPDPRAAVASADAPPATPRATEAVSGSLSLLTYNVAGLPDVFSKSWPSRNIPLISPLLRHYDIALIQEDFWYHPELAKEAGHQHASTPNHDFGLGDGLNRFTRFPWTDHVRKAWTSCNGLALSGSDCWAPKGFAVARTLLATDVWVDVYNVHFDAGRSAADAAARALQVDQIADTVRRRSRELAVIVAGDTNMRLTGELERLLEATGLRDVCESLDCEEGHIDRVLYRDGSDVELQPIAWRMDERFVDERGTDLSDHKAIGVELAWRVRQPPQRSPEAWRATASAAFLAASGSPK